MEAKDWTIRIHLDEEGDNTSACATLVTEKGSVEGTGYARRNPADPSVPVIGDELAASRALADLADKLADITQRDIAESVGAGAR